MPQAQPTEPITVRAAKDVVSEIDAIAAATDRSRNYVVNQALRQFVELHAGQIERIGDGVAAAAAGQVRRAEDVFGDIAVRHGWTQ